MLPPDPDTDPGFEEWVYLLSNLPEQEREELLQIARMKLERQEAEENKKTPGRRAPGAAAET